MSIFFVKVALRASKGKFVDYTKKVCPPSTWRPNNQIFIENFDTDQPLQTGAVKPVEMIGDISVMDPTFFLRSMNPLMKEIQRFEMKNMNTLITNGIPKMFADILKDDHPHKSVITMD